MTNLELARKLLETPNEEAYVNIKKVKYYSDGTKSVTNNEMHPISDVTKAGEVVIVTGE